MSGLGTRDWNQGCIWGEVAKAFQLSQPERILEINSPNQNLPFVTEKKEIKD